MLFITITHTKHYRAIFYTIKEYYGLDIISGSDLVFKLSLDSTITSFSILKFKNK